MIHWVTALMLIPMLAGGYFWLRPMASTDPLKLEALMYHTSIGMGLGALTLSRLWLRRGALAATGIALWAHRALYAAILLMPVSGMTMALTGKLNFIVFALSGAPLPADLATIPGHFAHGLTALTLTLLIALHLAGAFMDPAALRKMT